MPMARTIDSIVIHTYAVKGNLTVDQVRKSQMRERGFTDYAYHFGIQKDGTVEAGRNVETVGAGVYGHNAKSLHVALAGHGDFEPHTPAQSFALTVLLVTLLQRYPLARIVGHREFPAVAKTCPGSLIDMDRIRADATTARSGMPLTMPSYVDALRILTSFPVASTSPATLYASTQPRTFTRVSPRPGAFAAHARPVDGGASIAGMISSDGSTSQDLKHYLVRSYPDATKEVVCDAASLVAVDDAYLTPESRAWIALVRNCYNRS